MVTEVMIGEQTELVIPQPADLILPDRPSTTMMDGVLYMHDPVDVIFGLGIPPMNEWPGDKVTLVEVANACGSGKDYFRYWHRALRHLEAWDTFYKARDGRSDQWYYDHCDWNQRLIMGIWGGGKSSIMVGDGLSAFDRGIPVFHNGGPLFGWFLRGDKIFTAMATIPPCCKLKTDEAHMVAARRLGAMTSVGVMKDLGANIRRKLCEWDLVTGHYKDVHPQSLEDCVEVLEAIQLDTASGPKPEGLMPWDDPANFVLGWKHWGNSPFKNEDVKRDGLGDDYMYGYFEDWRAVRSSYALNDSFGRNDWGTALLSDREEVKNQLRDVRGDEEQGDRPVRRTPVENAVLDFVERFAELRDSPDGAEFNYVTAGQIASRTEFDPRDIGNAVKKVLPGVSRVRDKGYPADELITAWEREMGEPVPRL